MNIGVILFGGSGKRFSQKIPKQFLKFNGKTLMEHTLEKFFEDFIHLIVVVVNKDYLEKSRKILKKYGQKVKIITGGFAREYSTLSAINYLKDKISKEDNVIIHDGARPFVNKEVLLKNIEFVDNYGAVVTALPVENTIAFVENDRVKTVPPRKKLFSIQTPQTFKFSVLLEAFEKVKDLENYTDDSSVVLKAGFDVYVVMGEKSNIKITTKEDLFLAGVERFEWDI
ncbi:MULTISPECIES: 2-C-methyl-D-erythritol 4-phosphate cytidylyltransferase [unclassified Thermosipho (in: thermotogales)]|uniref:2-C-methyl-D-erythritol 4-phosphate cytidylyltransferase n=1 Tax=unclassified Thermosipho (in: thermotogales) TaxID=2676525 RepID=UPI000986F90B|nr:MULTISPECIES: 2-C-methyl-D-erythritol 4-phosphate cytidylyltransferase [unclassified Thermosipho (in: thermotogales)]MBT1248659.1 2-C-methyl-D-erythritol 4-phosphate cytidylyltransferase [Thermosipho sp. 1244]OOC47603.1 2-C-methyl-D-erythritol 4-phosphate cytidylyltransferase [Thermosipho sp. 1223]